MEVESMLILFVTLTKTMRSQFWFPCLFPGSIDHSTATLPATYHLDLKPMDVTGHTLECRGGLESMEVWEVLLMWWSHGGNDHPLLTLLTEGDTRAQSSVVFIHANPDAISGLFEVSCAHATRTGILGSTWAQVKILHGWKRIPGCQVLLNPALCQQLGEEGVLNVSLLHPFYYWATSEPALYGHFFPFLFILPLLSSEEVIVEALGINLPEWPCALGSRSSGWHQLL